MRVKKQDALWRLFHMKDKPDDEAKTRDVVM